MIITPLEVALACRKTRDEILTSSFPRCYGAVAENKQGIRVPANNPDAASWCAAGRVFHHLNMRDGMHLIESGNPTLPAAFRPGYPRQSLACLIHSGEIWGAWDRRSTKESAFLLAALASSIEQHLPTLTRREELVTSDA